MTHYQYFDQNVNGKKKFWGIHPPNPPLITPLIYYIQKTAL